MMTAETIDDEVFGYFTLLNEAEKKSVLEIIKIFICNRKNINDRVSIEEYNKEIDEAMARVATGEFTTQDELEKEMLTW